jgi:hypothetical protein
VLVSVGGVPDGFTVCASFAAAEQAVRDGVPRDRIAVDVDADGDAARAGAVAAVCVLLGFSVFTVMYVTQVQHCVDMTESVLGQRPPVLAVRGLA